MSNPHEPRDTSPGAGGGGADWRFSRRGFLKGAALSAGTAVITGGESLAGAAPAPAEPVGPEAVPVTLNINGKQNKLALEPRVTLLDACRNHLDLTGAKKVCDRATCGACTMIVDGKPVYACSVLAIECTGSKVQTVESLADDGKLSAVPAAFVRNDAEQCGFCTPGFVMACKAFVDKHPNPSHQEVLNGLGGNLCRCGTYVGVLAAAVEAGKGGR